MKTNNDQSRSPSPGALRPTGSPRKPRRQKLPATALCAVKWCAALATTGEHCPIHAKYPDLHPDYLLADEEFVPDMAPCDECDGSGDCDTCSGTGECEAHGTCTTCGGHRGHECGVCDGDGECHACNGEGRVTFRKKAEQA